MIAIRSLKWTGRRWRIASLLTLAFVAMISLPIALISAYSVRSFNGILLDNATARARQTLEQASYTLDTQFRLIKNTVASIANDQQVIRLASSVHFANSAQARLDLGRQLESQLSSYFHYTPGIVSVAFLFGDQGLDSYKQSIDIDEEALRRQSWFGEAQSRKNRVRIMGAEESSAALGDKTAYVTAAIAPSFGYELYRTELIYLVFKADELTDLMRIRSADAGHGYVVDPSGAIMVTTDGEAMTTGIDGRDELKQALAGSSGHYVRTANDRRDFIVYETSDSGWKYIQIYSYDRLTAQVNLVYRRILLLSALGLAVFLLVSYVLVRSIVRPMGSLVRQMSTVKAGQMMGAIEASGPLEVYVLGTAFNDMVGQLQSLIGEIGEKEKQKRLAEIDALQSQINPHFLLNTLNTIKLMAGISRATNIEKMTEALTKLLSSAFNRGGMYATVLEETRLLEYYVQIMKIRYGDRFDLVLDIEPKAAGLIMLRLLLQPIVENAIVHGIHECEMRGLISVRGRLREEGTLEFIISDNGRGMSAAHLGTLLGEREERESKGFNGIGFRNVHERLLLNYGPPYGLKIDSAPDAGTTVTLLLPVIYKEESAS